LLIKNFYYNSRSLTPINQLLLTLRFYATGNFLRACDFSGVSISTAFRVIAKVFMTIASLSATIANLILLMKCGYLWLRFDIYCQYWKSIVHVMYRFSVLAVNIETQPILKF